MVVSGSNEQNISGDSGFITSGDITRFDVASYSDGYVMGLVVDPTFGGKDVIAMTVAGDLSGEPDSRPADAGVNGQTNLQIVSDSNRALMVFSDALDSNAHDIKSTSFTPSNRSTVPSSPNRLSDNQRGGPLPQAGIPAAAVFPSGKFVVAWWDAEGGEIQGVRHDQAGTPDEDSFRIDIEATSSVNSLALDVFAHQGGDVTVVHPHIPQTHANLYATRFSGSPDSQAPGIQLHDTTTDSVDPSITPIFGSSGGNSASDLMVSWNEGPIVQFARIPLPLSAQALANPKVLSNTDEPMRSELATGADRAAGVGAVWIRTDGDDLARFAPISWDGVAICDPEARGG
jgi:hypothetical protein